MRMIVNNLWLLLAVAGALRPASAGAQEIRLRHQAVVDGPAVHLADVAELRELSASAGQAAIASLEASAATAVITVEQVQAALRRAGVNPVPIHFSGAARCTVRRAAGAVAEDARPPAAPAGANPDTVRSAASPGSAAGAVPAAPAPDSIGRRIQEQLLEQLAADAAQLTLSFTPASRATAELAPERLESLTSGDRNLLGRRCWRVDYRQGDLRHQRYVTATVALRRLAVVARRALGAGSAVTAEDVELAMRDDDGREDRMTSLEAVVGQQVRRPVEAGAAVRAGDLKAPMLIARGQLAWVHAGPVRVRAKALASGAAGESVQFENPQSQGRFWAQVTGPGAAQAAAAQP